MVSVENILSKARRDLSFSIDEPTAIEWIAECLDHIGVIGQYEEAIAFIEVKDFMAPMPQGLTHVIQLARNRCFVKETSCPAQIVEELTEGTEQNYVPIDCQGTPVAEYEMAYYRPFANLIYEYSGWTQGNYYNRCFSPIRLSHHTFFNTIVCQETSEDIKRFYQDAPESYTIKEPYFVLSFQEGQIAVAYRRVKVDERGYPLVPDDITYREAATRYFRYKVAQLKVDNDTSNAAMNYLMRAEQDWQWACKVAANKAMMMKGIDGHEDLTQQRSYLMPRVHRYTDFFGRLNHPESRNSIR